MKELQVYSPENVIAANLQETAKRFAMLGEQDLSHLKDLAEEIVDGKELHEILYTLPDRLPPAIQNYSTPSLQSAETFPGSANFLRLHRALLLCSKIRERLSDSEFFSTDAFFSEPPSPSFSESVRIGYQRSVYTDAAYLQFAPYIEGSRATYAHSFLSACEDVYNGLCDYCILPVENSTEGLLSSFINLILRYDLKIAMTCAINGDREDRITKFALLRRNLLPLPDPSADNRMFEFSLSSAPTPPLSEILTAANFYGLKLIKVDFFPSLENPSSDFRWHCSLEIQNGRLNDFLIYLAATAPHYTPIGLYQHLNKKGKI